MSRFPDVDFVYLVQGRADLTKNFLSRAEEIEYIMVATWDAPLDFESDSIKHNFFIPGTTWAEGRNFLFSQAKKFFPNSKYLIFCDEDVIFGKDFISKFEEKLLEMNPGIAVPLCDRIKSEGWISSKEIEHPVQHDQIFQAFRNDILSEGIVFPIDTEFDKKSWWITTCLQHHLIQSNYYHETLQFNTLMVHNSHHTLDIIKEHSESSMGSMYVNGKFSDSDLQELKQYIVLKYGEQRAILDTIFQPKIQDKLRVKNLNSQDIEKIFLLLLNRNWVKAIKYFVKVIFTFITNIYYTCFRKDCIFAPYKLPFM
jgi:hypothetical protein